MITPNKQAIIFDIRKMHGYKVFGYVRKCVDDDEQIISTLINQTHITRKHTYNYLPQKGIFKEFIKLVYTKNVYFETNEIGEMFRDFLSVFTGCSQLRNIYK
jgi:tRNA uridine 5-carbamoylmethylation protein Kti12